jgi:hypothetical protein
MLKSLALSTSKRLRSSRAHHGAFCKQYDGFVMLFDGNVDRRYFAVDTSTSSAFDRSLKQKQRNNAARAHKAWSGDEDAVDYNYFRQEMAYRLVDRLDDIRREEGFPLALDIGTFQWSIEPWRSRETLNPNWQSFAFFSRCWSWTHPQSHMLG